MLTPAARSIREAVNERMVARGEAVDCDECFGESLTCSAFCRSKPASEKYDCYLPRQCALAQFGFPGFNIPGELDTWHALVLRNPTTFGALATRLEALSESPAS